MSVGWCLDDESAYHLALHMPLSLVIWVFRCEIYTQEAGHDLQSTLLVVAVELDSLLEPDRTGEVLGQLGHQSRRNCPGNKLAGVGLDCPVVLHPPFFEALLVFTLCLRGLDFRSLLGSIC